MEESANGSLAPPDWEDFARDKIADYEAHLASEFAGAVRSGYYEHIFLRTPPGIFGATAMKQFRSRMLTEGWNVRYVASPCDGLGIVMQTMMQITPTPPNPERMDASM